MKFCQKCGKELMDEAVVCTACGCSVAQPNTIVNYGKDGLAIAIKIFLVIACVAQGWLIIPLAWLLPMTISLFRKMNRGEPISTGFKVCTLLFVNTIAGILLLCRSDNK